MGYLLSLLSSVCFGITNCLWLYPQKKQYFIHVIIFRSVVTVLLFTIAFLLFNNNNSYHLSDILIAISISLLSCLGLLFYTNSLRFTAVAIAVPVATISSFFGVLTGLIVFKEKAPDSFFLIAIGIITGLFLIEPKANTQLLPLTKGTVYNLLAATCWGITFALFKIPVMALGVWRFSLILEVTVLAFSILVALTVFKNQKFDEKIIKQNRKWYLLLGSLAFTAVISYTFALNYIDVSIAALLGNLTPVVSIILSFFLFRQKVTGRQWSGIAVLLLSLLVLNILR